MERSIEDVAQRASVDVAFVGRLMDLGACHPRRTLSASGTCTSPHFSTRGRSPSSRSSRSSPRSMRVACPSTSSSRWGWELPRLLESTYREVAEARGVPIELLRAIDRARPEDVAMVDLARLVLDIGGSEESVRRLFRVYADNLRRLVVAEADLYVEYIEALSDEAGSNESELMRRGAEVGRRIDRLVVGGRPRRAPGHRRPDGALQSRPPQRSRLTAPVPLGPGRPSRACEAPSDRRSCPPCLRGSCIDTWFRPGERSPSRSRRRLARAHRY